MANVGFMMRPGDDGISPRKRRRISPPQADPYILRQLLDELPLAVEDPNADVYITCVEYWSKALTWFSRVVVLNQPVNCYLKQMTTCTSAPPLRRSCISSACLRIPLINPANRPSFSRRDCPYSSPRAQPRLPANKVSNRLLCFRQSIKPVYSAMALLRSTCYRSSAQHLAIRKSADVAGLVASILTGPRMMKNPRRSWLHSKIELCWSG